MKLPSGKEISDEVLRDMTDDWAQLAFPEEHVSDIEDSFAEELELGNYSTHDEKYDEADRETILKAVYDVVVDVVMKLKEEYGKLYAEYIANKHWE